MPHPLRLLSIVAVLAGAHTGALAAQESPLILELHGGAAIPIRSFDNGTRTGEGAEPGASFGIDLAFPGGGRLTPYLGFSQHRFGCEAAGCAAGGRYVGTGFHVGYRITPFPGHRLLPWIRLGVVTTRVETDALAAPNAGLTDLGFGGEGGFGIHVGGASTLALNPGVRLVAVNTGLPGGDLLRMRYLVADLSVVVSF